MFKRIRRNLILMAAVAMAGGTLAFGGSALLSSEAQAGSCQGVVGGLSSTYNLKRGSGFLAIRSRPTSRSRMKGQLFNGNVVEIDRRVGNWLYVWSNNGTGWVHGRWVRRGCDGV